LRATAHQPAPVDPGVVVEAVVLGGQEGLHQAGRDLVERQRHAPLLAELRDQRPVAGEHPQGHLQAHLAQRLDVGQARREVDVGRRERQHAGRESGQAGGEQPTQGSEKAAHARVARRNGRAVTGLTAPGAEASINLRKPRAEFLFPFL